METFDTLLQYYISTLGFIIALYLIQYIFEEFLHADLAKQMANSDYLTGLPNRRKIDHELSEQIKNSKEKGIPLTLILFDIDNFKCVNDIYGHDIGDIILQEISSVVQSVLPNNMLFGRWGGEEFLLIAPTLNRDEGYSFAEMVRKGIEAYSFTEVGKITASFGVSELLVDDSASIDVLKRADDALYEAKKRGKNQVYSL